MIMDWGAIGIIGLVAFLIAWKLWGVFFAVCLAIIVCLGMGILTV